MSAVGCWGPRDWEDGARRAAKVDELRRRVTVREGLTGVSGAETT